jgi:hypothetical protein
MIHKFPNFCDQGRIVGVANPHIKWLHHKRKFTQCTELIFATVHCWCVRLDGVRSAHVLLVHYFHCHMHDEVTFPQATVQLSPSAVHSEAICLLTPCSRILRVRWSPCPHSSPRCILHASAISLYTQHISGELQQNFVVVPCIIRSRGSSVSSVSGYGLDDRAIQVRSPAEAEDFSSKLWVRWVPGVLSPEIKVPGAWHWPLTPI